MYNTTRTVLQFQWCKNFHGAKRGHPLGLIKESYVDFEPTLATQMLAEHQGFNVSRETVRKWML